MPSPLFFIGSLALAVMVQEPTKAASYRDWEVYTVNTGGDTICYAISEPTRKSPRSVDHGDVYFAVSSWRSGKAERQPSFLAGYDLRESAKPRVQVESDRWTMFAAGDEAFIDGNGDESRLVGAMRRGSDMQVTATSARGTNTEYTFSLLGISDALERVEQACS